MASPRPKCHLVVPRLLIGLFSVLLTAAAQLPESNLASANPGSGDLFGSTLALDQRRVAVGAPGELLAGGGTGAVHIHRQVGGAWSSEGKLVASMPSSSDDFARDVAVDGNLIAVGAPGSDAFGIDSGAVHVFRRIAGVWTQEAWLRPFDLNPYDGFGEAVAVSGDTLAVGCPGHDVPIPNGGAVYVYRYLGGAWQTEDKLLPPTMVTSSAFGAAVALEGERLVVGRPGDQPFGFASGMAFTYLRSGITWSLDGALFASNGAPHRSMGAAVAISGDRAVVGAPGSSNWSVPGTAVVFSATGGGWGELTTLQASDIGTGYHQFGEDVALSGHWAVIGARAHGGNGAQSGAAYLYDLRTSEEVILHASDGLPGDLFGDAVAIEEGLILAGAPGDTVFGNQSGSVYAYGMFFTGVEVLPGGAIRYSVRNIPAGTFTGWTLVSADTSSPVQQGPIAGFAPDSLTLAIIDTQGAATVGGLFHWIHGFPGFFPDAPFEFPAGTAALLAGLTFDHVAVALDPLGALNGISTVARIAY